MQSSPSHQNRRAPVGKRRRGPGVTLRGLVSPEHKRLAELGADARGVSLARYMELVIEMDEVARWMKEIEDLEAAKAASTPPEEEPSD